MAVARYNCDYCNNLVYDEEMEGYVCDVDMDEDDYARLVKHLHTEQCPYYQSNDEYKSSTSSDVSVMSDFFKK